MLVVQRLNDLRIGLIMIFLGFPLYPMRGKRNSTPLTGYAIGRDRFESYKREL